MCVAKAKTPFGEASLDTIASLGLRPPVRRRAEALYDRFPRPTGAIVSASPPLGRVKHKKGREIRDKPGNVSEGIELEILP